MFINNRGMIFVTRAICLTIFVAVCSCSGSQNRPESRKRSSEIPLETYIQINKQLVADEQKIIQKYIEDEGLEMAQTQTGLWYSITKPGSGSMITKGQVVVLNYSIHLLDGTLCYTSDDKGPKTFLVGQGGVESGLEEGVLMLQNGSNATFIMPPHLAHGLIGDDGKIPSRAILRYEVVVLEVKNNNNN